MVPEMQSTCDFPIPCTNWSLFQSSWTGATLSAHLMLPPQGMVSGKCGDPPATDTLSESESHPVVFDSLRPHGLYSPWNSPVQNTGMGSISLLQGIFPTQGSNSGLPHCRWIPYQLSHNGRPRILEWVAYPFSRGSSQPRNQTRVSSIAGGFFTN